jgi:preprotein translocase subunit SecA
MSHVGALVAGRDVQVNAGVYLERRDRQDNAAEQWLRSVYARLPRRIASQARIDALVAAVAQQESATRPFSDSDLREHLHKAGMQLRKTGFQGDHMHQALAIVREASRRTLGMRPHDVQIVGAWAMLQGWVAEMATGEGKTLVAALAASVAAATGAATHVVTVNDYLAERDAEQNTALFTLLGLRCGIVKADMEPQDRRAQYAKDITYVSNKELVFDYLKDRIATKGILPSHLQLYALARHRDGQVSPSATPVLLRGLHVAIVDEADSVLIDEARTPLIISETEPDEMGEELYQQALALAERMQNGLHYDMSRDKQVWLNPQAEIDVHAWSEGLGGVWTSAIWRRELIQKALTALHCFHLDQHYIIAEDKIQIVDEFTGRVMPDRSWERGLHQMIEAKEKVEISGRRKTLSQMTYQRFFRRYLLLCGMTGTAKEIETELKSTYELNVLRIPTHKPPQRTRLADRCCLTDAARWEAVAEAASQMSQQGRPVLVGTRSVEASEKLSAIFEAKGIAHTMLNARQDKAEAEAVAQAGEPGRITVATNMAGRGTDIKLAPGVNERGGLHVILTEFHESARVDRQLFGRSARQGNAGSAQAVVAIDDDVFMRFAWPMNLLGKKLHRPDGSIAPHLLKLIVSFAQMRAEARNQRTRVQAVKQDRKTQEMMGFTGSNS